MTIDSQEQLNVVVRQLSEQLKEIDSDVKFYESDGLLTFRSSSWSKLEFAIYLIRRINDRHVANYGLLVDLPIESGDLKQKVHHAYVEFKATVTSILSGSSPVDVPPADLV